MSRESLLDEAIAKAKECEDWQLVEWLRMARGGESAARWYTAKLSEARLDISNLMTENAKLRELVRDVMPIVCNGCRERLCEMPKEEHPFVTCSFADRMRELGIEVDG